MAYSLSRRRACSNCARLFALAALSLAHPCAHALPNEGRKSSSGDDSEDAESNASIQPHLAIFYANEGCSLKPAALDLNGKPRFKTLSSCGDAALDAKFNAEFSRARTLFSLSPLTLFLDDVSNPNAYAAPPQMTGTPDGGLFFGVTLTQDVVATFRHAYSGYPAAGEAGLMAIMAHEMGHLVQYKLGLHAPAQKYLELHADFIAGWYMAWRQASLSGFDVITEAATEMARVGDFDFQNPDHHGTPNEPIAAFSAGVQQTARALALGGQPSPLDAAKAGWLTVTKF